MNDRQRRQIHEAMVRLAHGDRDAFSIVFDGLWPHVLGFMNRAAPGPDAEDLAQRTLLKIFARISDFDVSRDGPTWAFGIAAYEVKTLRRQLQRRRETTVDALDRVMDEASSPEDIAIEEDLRQALFGALGQLSSADQAALLERGADPASAGVTAAAWRKRRQRALERLRAVWRRRDA